MKRGLLLVFLLVCTYLPYSFAAQNFIDICRQGTPEQVKAAIDAGADVNAGDENGKTPLMYCGRI